MHFKHLSCPRNVDKKIRYTMLLYSPQQTNTIISN